MPLVIAQLASHCDLLQDRLILEEFAQKKSDLGDFINRGLAQRARLHAPMARAALPHRHHPSSSCISRLEERSRSACASNPLTKRPEASVPYCFANSTASFKMTSGGAVFP